MKKIIFVTGTRADYGKMKSLIKYLQKKKLFKVFVFITGMHNLKKFGSTWEVLKKDKIRNKYRYNNQKLGDSMDIILSKTILGFGKFVKKIKPDLIIIHGDRIETLACAIVGSLNNFKTAHIEGGEVSGAVDEILRHSISKLCHVHFVTNNIARKRLIQMGEVKKNIFIIGSPDVDIIKSKQLPTITEVKKRYNIKFSEYAVAIFHPVTTELEKLRKNCKIFIKAILESNTNYVIIWPNNDTGSEIILEEYQNIKSNENIKIFPSMRFEYYLTLLKNSHFIIGNSSSGIMEAPYYGVPTINIGNRKNNRTNLKTINNCNFSYFEIKKLINKFKYRKIRYYLNFRFGYGKSFQYFNEILNKKEIWKISTQKQFQDIN